ncbi:HAMP domain-containing sensor histidine kinase [Actinomadura sp. NPDC048032]|uniref:sensor histidine kinase n=1 Tax=Actinomadura sp. NPDC048032 TaxID=3155747 RepID=UPI0033D365F4
MVVLSLLTFGALGIGVEQAVRARIENAAFKETQRVAGEWIGSMNSPKPGQPSATSRVPYLQLVDPRGRVVAASRAAGGRPAISTLWPPFDDQIQNRVQCADGQCLMLTASRVSPQRTIALWNGDTHVVYAAMPRPAVLDAPRLHAMTAAIVLVAVGLTGWGTWWVVGRTLRPVESMRKQIAEITIGDLSRRLTQPPGDDEIARLARTANQGISKLENATKRQRRFGSMVSHELRRPLTGLRAHLEEVLLAPDADCREGIQGALVTAERLQAIIDEMLELAHVSSGRRAVEPVDLNALARAEAERVSGGPPIVVHAADEAAVLGNQVQLTGVLTNLLVNAQRHTRTSVHLTVGRSEGQATVTVLDDGKGIPPGDRERVFQPFVRLREGRRRDPHGSGLGLAICRAVAESHNGTLQVEDSPRGACFVLRIPLAPTGSRPEESVPAPPSSVYEADA